MGGSLETRATSLRSAVRRITALGQARGFPVLLGVSLVVSLLMGFRPSITPLGPGIDNSHLYALQQATVRGWRWGVDFVSTHGPYSYVIDTLDIGDLPTRRAVFELVLAVASGIVIALTARSVPGLRIAERLVLALLLAYALHLQVVEYRWFGLFWLCFLLGVHGSGWAGLGAYAAAGLLGGFYVLIKLSLGGGAFLTLAVGCVLTRMPSVAVARFIVAAAASTAGLLAGWTAHFGALASLSSHLELGWEIAAGYSSGMSLARAGWWASAVAFVIFLAILAWWATSRGNGRARLTLAAAAVPLFIVWKHALVRSGPGHMHLLHTFPLLVVAVLLGDSWSTLRRARSLAMLGAAVAVLLLPWVLEPSRVHPRESLIEHMLVPLRGDAVAGPTSLIDWRHHRATVAAQSAQRLRARVLSESERALLGDASVDVYPFEISYVPANRLTWRNRPFVAPYAFTPRLDDLNATFLASEDRPAFLLWHTLPPEQREYRGAEGVLTLDGRHVLWDEPRTIRTILSAYDVRMVGSSALILARRATVRSTSAERLETVSVDWHAWTDAPAGDDGMLMADIFVARSWLSRGLRLVVREDPTYVAVRLADGETREYRFSPDVAADGLWISPFPVSADELVSVLRGGPARRVTAIRVRGGLASGSNPPLQVAWWRLRVSPPLRDGAE